MYRIEWDIQKKKVYRIQGRLVQDFQVSSMGLVHSKPITDVWLENLFVQTHTSNPQGMGF